MAKATRKRVSLAPAPARRKKAGVKGPSKSGSKKPSAKKRVRKKAARSRRPEPRRKAAARAEPRQPEPAPAGEKPPAKDVFGNVFEPSLGQLLAKYRKNAHSLTISEYRQLREWQSLQGPKDVPDVTLSLAAELLGCTERNVKEMRRAGKIEAGGKARIDLRSLCAYLREYMDKRLKKAADPRPESIAFFEREIKDLRSQLMRIELDRESGELVNALEITSQFRVAGHRLRTAFEGIAREHGADVGEAIRDAINEVVRELGM